MKMEKNPLSTYAANYKAENKILKLKIIILK